MVHNNVHCVEDVRHLILFSCVFISVCSVCSVVPTSVLFWMVVQGSRQVNGCIPLACRVRVSVADCRRRDDRCGRIQDRRLPISRIGISLDDAGCRVRYGVDAVLLIAMVGCCDLVT